MKQWLANAPMRRKLTALMAATAAVALVLAGLALGGYEVMTFRRTLAQKLTTVAEIVGRNCTAALAFGDRSAARDVLNALQAEPAVRSGAVYDRAGRAACTACGGVPAQGRRHLQPGQVRGLARRGVQRSGGAAGRVSPR